jgi:hypothetical protein
MIEVIMLYWIIQKRLNFIQMSQYSSSEEKRFRQQFEQKFDFIAFIIGLAYQFQIEFCYRDAKQATRLTHCLARSLNKLCFHINASFNPINIAKVTHQSDQETKDKPFPIANA